MALSNWDTLAFDTEGKPSNGVLSVKYEDEGRRSVELYKNWVYVHSDKMWVDGHSFTNNCIAEIQEGDVNLAGFKIKAVRNRAQSSVFVFVEYGWKHLKGSEYGCMSGIGCYGYNYDRWVGVEDYTVENFYAFLEEVADKDYFEKVHDTDPLRFNQGDAYFAEKCGENIPVTPLGEVEEPVITKLL